VCCAKESHSEKCEIKDGSPENAAVVLKWQIINDDKLDEFVLPTPRSASNSTELL